jgi:tetratricopeptide (TPR) repeat protein
MRLITLLAILSLVACSSANEPAPAPQAQAPKQIPITSKSAAAVEHFNKGRDLADNLRQAEAASEFDEALKLDPDFALALLGRGMVTPGPKGLSDIEEAKAKASSVTKGEQMLIDAVLAGRRGERARSEEIWAQLADSFGDDWRVHMGRGAQLYGSEKYDEAIASLTKATTLEPSAAGPAYNMMGYAYLVRGQTAPAIEALKKYAALNPDEPNPQDSLGEALMAAGQMADAEASFRKAASMSTPFPVAWEGVAYTKFFRGDWAGGRQALEEARKASSRASDRASADQLAIAATFAEGRTAEGMKQLDSFAASSDTTPADVAFTAVFRGVALIESGRNADAAAQGMKAVESAGSGKFPPFITATLERWGWSVQSAAAGLSRDPGGAQKAADALQTAAAKRPDDPQLQSSLHLAQGMLAAANNDIKTARTHFDRCSDTDTYCHWQATAASQKAGDTSGAETSRARLTRVYQRDPNYLYGWSRIAGKQAKASN